MLRPHHRKHTQLDQVWFASEQLLYTREFFGSEIVCGDYFRSDLFHDLVKMPGIQLRRSVMFIARAGTSSKATRRGILADAAPSSKSFILVRLRQWTPGLWLNPLARSSVTYCLLPASLSSAARNSSGLMRPKCLKTTLPSLS